MNLFEELINFLEEKALNINNNHKYVNERMIENNSQHVPNLNLLYNEINNYNNRQIEINGILHLLSDLIKLKKESKLKRSSYLLTNLDNFINIRLQQIANNETGFNSKHPLFGFKPFHEKLITYFAKLEYFERCSEIIKQTKGK